ncbi:eEF1A lysine and N-terminal methyltransferase-like [Salvia splendens]|uniref:eEF1A lysine and N-terminal methyltransferase-like n=1 Tax=Salvia splendens TaxID=180675 RepID=UPI001C27AF45|nr:eEF1A lysine and N-terminal methyltransferase-like [Salvia splendens]
MGKKKSKQQRRIANGEQQIKQEEILKTLGDFTDKDNWDKFFTLRGSEDNFEWYAEWPQLRSLLTDNLSFPEKPPKEVTILVPGCGNSKLSEQLYDAGFQSIMNIDFSKVVIMDMLRRNVRERPDMKWRVMDMAELQFDGESFNAVVDKGGLDALMEPKLGSRLGILYLSEVKRVLETGGKFICLTLAESHVLDLLLREFRFGWKMSIHAISHGPPYGTTPELQTFVVVAEKDTPTSVSDLSLFLGEYSIQRHGNQARNLYEMLEKERHTRTKYSNNSDMSYTMEDLRLGAKGNISMLEPGRRIKLILGEPGVSNFFYNCMLLDAKPDSGQFVYPYGVFIVPQLRAHDWLYTSEEGQWLIVVSAKAARLCMVFLDSSNSIFPMQSIQSDLSPLVKQLAPNYGDNDNDFQIPFMAAGDGIKKRDIVHQVESDLTGLIIVDDVIYEAINKDDPYKGHKYRRLIFERSENLVQSEALLSSKFDSHSSRTPALSSEAEVIHNHLASPYHNGIISGIMLISSHLSIATSFGGLVKTAVLGLGAGLLPMFMKKNLPTLQIEVIELDPVVLDVARDFFGFEEDERLKVHVTDGIKFVKEIADSKVEGEEKSLRKIDILVVDVDSSDTSSGLTCPEADFVEEYFLLAAKESLSEQGLFIINLVSRSSTMKDAVYTRLKKVFSNIFCLKIEEDVNEVLFALKTDFAIEEQHLSEARNAVARYSEEAKEWGEKVVHLSKSIELLS